MWRGYHATWLTADGESRTIWICTTSVERVAVIAALTLQLEPA